jgi:hypothetical protein
MKRTVRIVALCAVAIAAVSGVVMTGVSPAGAEPPSGCHYNAAGQLVCNGGTGGVIPGGPGGGGDPGPGTDTGPGGGGGGGSGGGSECRWVPTSNQEETLRVLYPDAPPGSVVAYYECNFGTAENPDWQTLISSAVFPPDEEFGAAPTPPPPITVAQRYWAEVEGTLERPVLQTSPPAGSPIVVDQPAFFAVANWEVPTPPSECDTSTPVTVCVSLHFEPTLLIDPGEPGVPTFECAPPGSWYDPASALTPVEQASDGACAHIYRQRTGVAGRPDSWDARAIVAWRVTWSSDQPVAGVGGSLGTHNLTSEILPRQVDEVQGIVVETGDGTR